MRIMSEKKQWGYLRETKEMAQKSGVDPDTGLCRTGLEEYLAVIFPDIDDWVHDKALTLYNPKCRQRPDYRSEKLKMIVEYDGIYHYSNPLNIRKDGINTKMYKEWGYKVLRIPYFIQLTNKAVETLFGVKCDVELFDENVPSMGIKGESTPSFLCPYGISRMAMDFTRFPEQYAVNLKALKAMDDDFLSGATLLELEYNKLQKL